jgi:hypothetical protein
MLRTLLALLGVTPAQAGQAAFPFPRSGENLRYRREGYAETRDALAWVMLYADRGLKFGLTLDDVFKGLEHGYQSVRRQLSDPERIADWEKSREKMHAAYFLFAGGNGFQGTRTLQEAQELFIGLRRIGGRRVSRQELGDTEHGANELDE